jgi:hypothetical protein
MRKLLLIVGTFVVAGSAGAQTTLTADDIIARYITENLADPYGAVVFYDGRPSQMQLDRTDAIGHELSDVVATFDAWSTRDLAAINTELGTKNLQPIVLISRQDWDAVGKGGQ